MQKNVKNVKFPTDRIAQREPPGEIPAVRQRFRANWSKTVDHHRGNRAAAWRIHICHFKEPGSQLFQLVNNVFCSDPAFRSLSEKAIYGQWSRTTQNKGREAGEIEEVSFIAHRAELRAGGSHGYELDRANP